MRVVDPVALRLQDLAPHLVTRDLWAAVHRFRRRLQMDTTPDIPVVPDEAFERWMIEQNPFNWRRAFGFLHGDDVVATFGVAGTDPSAPDYGSRRHVISASGNVLRELRRQGIARRSLPRLRALAGERGATTITFVTDNDDGRGFLRRLGAELKNHSIDNKLEIAAIDWALVDRWIEDGKRRSPGTTIEIHEGRVPQALWEEVSRVYTQTTNDQHFDELDVGRVAITPESMRESYARLALVGADVHTFLAREPDGAISSHSTLKVTPARPDVIEQVGTGTIHRYRGRGLAKWVKAESLRWVARRCPEARAIVTHNGRGNAAILAINEALGFEEQRRVGLYQMRVHELDRAIADLGP